MDVFDTFATHSGLAYDVIDSDCRAQNGSTHGRVFAIFKRRFLTNRIIIAFKSCVIIAFKSCVSMLYSISSDRGRDATLELFRFKRAV